MIVLFRFLILSLKDPKEEGGGVLATQSTPWIWDNRFSCPLLVSVTVEKKNDVEPFQPSAVPVEKVELPMQPKTIFLQGTQWIVSVK